MTVKRGLLLAALLIPFLLLTSCASGPTPPEKGTPAFYWQAAKETFTAGDFLKASDHLESLSRSPNEFTAKALPWRLILTAGITKGYMDLADGYEFGARANKANPTPFRKMVSEYRTRANRYALLFAETFDKFQQSNKDPQITLAFPFPQGSSAQSPALLKASQGFQLNADEDLDAAKRTLGRSIIQEVTLAAGASTDVAKAQQLFSAGEAKVSREAFLIGMAKAFVEQSQLYESRKLDQPDRMKAFCARASDALKGLPDSKEIKELNAKIQKLTSAKKK